MVFRLLLISVLTGLVHLRSLPAPSPLLQKAPQSIDFLKKYGYLPGPTYNGQLGTRVSVLEELFTKDAVENAIKEAQRFGGLKETGALDDETVKLFSSKRCGVPDIIRNTTSFSEPDDYRDEETNHYSLHHHHHHHDHHRKKRYVLNGTGWKKRHLKFAFRNWAGTLSQSEVEQETEKALDIWAKYGHLKFTRTNDPNDADITIGFYRGQHGDVNPFDGKGNVLAHAYFPVPYAGKGLAGDVHFDDDETWSVGQANGRYAVDYTTVALHELGHSLGLSHSHEHGSVMNPYYKGTHSLGDDDIRGMYDLYASQPMEYPGQDPHRGPNHNEERRKYEQHKKEWEKRQEEERRRLEEEERKERDRKRQDDEQKYEEEKRKYEETRKRHEERLREEDQRRKIEEKQDEEMRRRLDQESRMQEEKHRKWNERATEENRRYEEEKRRQEAAKRAVYERRKNEEERLREENKAGRGKESSSKSHGYPNGTTFEGDFETVDHHKKHDSTHQIPAKQGDQGLSDGEPSRKTQTSDENDACMGSFDTAAFLRGELFITKGKMLWRLSRPGVVQKGYPTEVHRFFHLLPEEVKRIDAMYQRDRDESLIIFSGRKFWVFDGWKFVEGSPRSIEDYGLPKEVDRVDAATSRNNEVLLFSGDRYWSLNDTISLQPLEKRASQPISALRGLPDSLDAALTYNDVVYFFKGDRFWYQDRKTDSPTLHKAPASEYWIAC